MLNQYKSQVTIAGVTKTVVAINHKEETEVSESKSFDSMIHYILQDQSGSMYDEINKAVDQIELAVDAIDDGDYVTIIGFSGEGQCEVYVENARKDAKTMKLLLQKLRRTIGSTCFSEPLTKVGEMIKKSQSVFPNITINLFTDGQPCVWGWSTQAEIAKSLQAVSAYKDQIVALNTIGFGNWYNRDFLVDLSNMSMFGQMVHSSKISEYSEIFKHNYERVRDVVAEAISISSKVDHDIVYLGRKTVKMSKGLVELKAIDKIKNQFFIVGEGDFSFDYNGEIVNTADIKGKIPAPTLTNFMYAYGQQLYYNGRTQESLDVYALNLRDKFFIDAQTNAFTYDERSEALRAMEKAIFKNNLRMVYGEAPANYIPAADAFCVMDLLKILASGENFYVPNEKEYTRIGRKVTDNYNLFVRNKDEQLMAPFNDFVFNSSMLNLSIRYMITGYVEPNPKAAKARGLDLPEWTKGGKLQIPARTYRNHTIIKDGNLNLKVIDVILDSETLAIIEAKERELGKMIISDTPSKFDRPVSAEEPTENKTFWLTGLYLDVLPIINRTYLSESARTANVLRATVEETKLEALQKVTKFYIEQIKDISAAANKENAFREFTVEQIEFLKENGLNSKLDYVGVDNKMAEKSENDFYEARSLEFQLKGVSALPTVNKVLEKLEKMKGGDPKVKLTSSETYIANAIGQLKARGIDLDAKTVAAKRQLEEVLKQAKQGLFDIRVDLNSMKIAKVLTGDWFADTETNDKGQYLFSEGDDTLVIKAEREKIYF